MDLNNVQFGRLTVFERGPKSPCGTDRMWYCRCACGQFTWVRQKALRKGSTKSCGCLQRETVKRMRTIHGASASPEFMSWAAMRSRCTNPNQKSYADYGKRGITVCKRWATFKYFLEDMGLRPTPQHTVERVNNNIGYRPSNCRWATRKEQNRNTRVTRWLTYRGQRKCLSEWAELVGLKPVVLTMRLKRGWTVAATISRGKCARGEK